MAVAAGWDCVTRDGVGRRHDGAETTILARDGAVLSGENISGVAMQNEDSLKMDVISHLQLQLAWLIFALWGVIAREIPLPLPLSLALVCFSGGMVALMFVRRPLRYSRHTVAVAGILVLDLLFLLAGFQRVPFATVIALHYTGPIFVMALSPLVLGEPFRIANLTLSVLGCLAVVGLVWSELSVGVQVEAMTGLACAALSGLTLAGNIMYQRRCMLDLGEPGNAVFAYNLWMLGGFLVMLAPWCLGMAACRFASVSVPLWESVLWALGAGVLSHGVAMLLFNTAIKRLPSQAVGLMSFSEIGWVTAIGWAWYGEAVRLEQGVCILIITALVVFASRRSGQKEADAHASNA